MHYVFGKHGWIAVGDAAATHDPLSADGITRALIGGMEAARIFQEGEGAPIEYARMGSAKTGTYSMRAIW